jgi:hypothetical protein
MSTGRLAARWSHHLPLRRVFRYTRILRSFLPCSYRVFCGACTVLLPSFYRKKHVFNTIAVLPPDSGISRSPKAANRFIINNLARID